MSTLFLKNLFKLIINYINKPTNEKEKTKKIKKKEEKTILHLENTYELVGNLNNNDIKVIKTIMSNEEFYKKYNNKRK